MPKKHRATSSENRFSNLPMLQQIQRARPLALELLLEGISQYERRDDDTIGRVFELVQNEDLDRFFKDHLEEDQRVLIGDAIFAGQALGIALGLMLRGDAFLADEKGGAR